MGKAAIVCREGVLGETQRFEGSDGFGSLSLMILSSCIIEWKPMLLLQKHQKGCCKCDKPTNTFHQNN